VKRESDRIVSGDKVFEVVGGENEADLFLE